MVATPFHDHMISIDRLAVSSILIANEPDLGEFVVVWPLVIANDPDLNPRKLSGARCAARAACHP
jgi:hypothetical protein